MEHVRTLFEVAYAEASRETAMILGVVQQHPAALSELDLSLPNPACGCVEATATSPAPEATG